MPNLKPPPHWHCFLRLEMLCGVVFGLWNNLSTVFNAVTLFEKVR